MQARAHMAGKRDDRGYRFHIRLVMIRNNRLRRYLRTGYSVTEKRFRTSPVPFVTQEHINNLPVLVDCPV
jgi:hypothetical protein